jgi:nucleotide-binding universal stress UspA family protein
MTNNLISRGSIVVGVDGSPSADAALPWAADAAARENRPLAIIHAVHMLTAREVASFAPAGISLRELEAQVSRDAHAIIEHAARSAEKLAPDVEITTLVRPGDPRELLLNASEDAATVVVGSRGHGHIASLLLGSVSAALVRHAACSVAVVRRRSGVTSQGVLVSADGSTAPLAVVETAYRQASLRGLPLTVVHCLWDPFAARVRWTYVDPKDLEYDEARSRVAESVAGMSEKFPDVELLIDVTRGAIDACLIDMSRAHELLVVGRGARTLSERLALPSATTSIVEHAASTVIVVP